MEARDRDPGIGDCGAFADARRFLDSVKVGVWLTEFTGALVIVYSFLTWSEPRRESVVLIAAATMVLTPSLLLLPLRSIVESRWRDAFFCTWSATIVVVVASLAALGGGVEGPLVTTFFLPLAFAGLSYPRNPAMLASALVIFGYAIVAATTARAEVADTVLFAGLLTAAAMLCISQATRFESQRLLLSAMARTDPLTDALNRRGLEEQLLAEFTRAGPRRPVALILLDVDGFKVTNDTFGHEAGDELLRWTASALRGVCRADDAVARLGGDEFAVVATGVDAAIAQERAREIRTTLAERISVSAGVAVHPEDGEDLDALYRAADSALYAEKAVHRRAAIAATR